MDNLCETCEECEKLDDNFCVECHLKNIQYNYSKDTNYIELYKLTLEKNKENISRKLAYGLNKLQRQILSALGA